MREQKTIRASEEDPQKLNRLQLITKAVLALIFRIKFFNAKTIQLKITITDGKVHLTFTTDTKHNVYEYVYDTDDRNLTIKQTKQKLLKKCSAYWQLELNDFNNT